jgi:flagellar FliL protein
MAEEDKSKEAAPEEQPKKKSPIILVVVLVLVGLVLAGGISFFVTTKMMANTVSSDGGASTNHDPGVFIKLGDAKEGILVNVGGGKQSKFLKAGIVLEMNPGKTDNIKDGKLTTAAETKVLDTTMEYLRKAPLENFSAAKQEELKKNLKDALNDKLGQGSVYDVYITSFLLQ